MLTYCRPRRASGISCGRPEHFGRHRNGGRPRLANKQITIARVATTVKPRPTPVRWTRNANKTATPTDTPYCQVRNKGITLVGYCNSIRWIRGRKDKGQTRNYGHGAWPARPLKRKDRYGILHPMNVEDTMKFILESQARAEARADRADARADRADARMDRADARMDRAEKKAERELTAIRKLLLQGMKSLAELRESQKDTDRALKEFIRNQGNGRRSNGKSGH
jgi:hypothetical protein